MSSNSRRALFPQAGEPRVAALQGFRHPAQVIPHQQVGEKLVGRIDQALRVLLVPVRHRGQPQVRCVAVDHALPVGAQAVPDKAQSRLWIPRQGGLRQGRQHRIADGAVALQVGRGLFDVMLDLLQQHRGEVHHRASIRDGFEMRRHVDVILDGVQVGPGQVHHAGAQIAVLGLVHMPQQHHAHGLFIGMFIGHSASAVPACPA